MSKLCLHGHISGIVQGVYYRQSTCQQALAENVSGWAKNLPDGRVEVLLCGEASAVRKVEQWLHQGPTRARVDDVQLAVTNCLNITGFETY